MVTPITVAECSAVISGEDLDAAIASEEVKLAELERHRDAAQRRLSELRVSRDRAGSSNPDAGPGAASSASWTPERKVALFASLFRGREDVFPMRWQSRDKAKKAGRHVAPTSGNRASARSRA